MTDQNQERNKKAGEAEKSCWINLIYSSHFFMSCKLYYFFINFGLISASASYTKPSYEKKSVIYGSVLPLVAIYCV